MPSRGDGPDELIDGLRRGDRRALARAITLAESTLPEHARLAARVIEAVLPATGKSLRLAISGVPGAGKSTLIEALGQHIIALGLKPAVLAVDPSSPLSGGAILGDKTRMERLAARPEAYVRPSPSGGRIGGVAARTREAILLCEAAGFDVVVVETVGTGQSEIAAAQITDLFVLLQIPGAGDDLQAMKKGALELADVIVVNKCDADTQAAARLAHDLAQARPGRPIAQVSARTGAGIEDLWNHLARLRAARGASNEFGSRRSEQSLRAIWENLEDEVLALLRNDPRIREAIGPLAKDVSEGRLGMLSAIQQLMARFQERP